MLHSKLEIVLSRLGLSREWLLGPSAMREGRKRGVMAIRGLMQRLLPGTSRMRRLIGTMPKVDGTVRPFCRNFVNGGGGALLNIASISRLAG